MGREATCHFRWGADTGDCKVLLEGGELIFRQGIRRRVPVSEIAGVAVRGNELVFNVGEDDVELALGSDAASRWAKALTSPPPSLAAKLGLSPATNLEVIGDVQSRELQDAIAENGVAPSKKGAKPDLGLISVNSKSEADLLLHPYLADKAHTGPLWVVYPKGSSSSVRESDVRELFRHHGFIDTKVVSVSAKLTALRFVRRKATAEG
jgi:hypothetical protein